MTFFDELGLKAAEQLEASVGPYVALASYKRLFGAEGSVREQGVLGALRCAIKLGDDREVETAAKELARLRGPTPIALGFAASLLDAGKAELAARVASAELERTESALAAYVRARAGERSGALDPSEWDAVAERAQRSNDSRVLTHAAASFVDASFVKVRRDRNASLPRARLAELGEQASLAFASPRERIILSRARLFSQSRFQRASALSNLEAVARECDAPARDAAIQIVARHFDGMPGRLDSVELDRIRATLKHAPEPAAARALKLMAEPHVPSAAELSRDGGHSAMTRAALRVLAGETPIAALSEMTGLLGPDLPVPAVAWSVATAAIDSEEPEVRRAAVHFTDRALARSPGLPAGSMTDIAEAMLRAGAPEAAERALLEAARHREAPALRTLALAKRASGYAALARGERTGALALLEEAEALFLAIRGDKAAPP